MDRRRVSVRVSGVVQGVFFRVETRRAAQGLGLHGSVRNLMDGSVEVIAEGDPRDVEQLIAWCRKGPPHARVDRVTVTDEEPRGDTSGFSIAY
jgi:acylphosphatase